MRGKMNSSVVLSKEKNSVSSADYGLALLCAAAVFAIARLTGTEAPWLPAAAGAGLCLLDLAFGKRTWFRSGVFALLVLSLLLLRTGILDGFCQWRNRAAAVYTAETGLALPLLEESGSVFSSRLFEIWAGAALGMCFVLASHWGRAGGSLFTLLLCAGGSLTLGRMADPLPLILASAMLCVGHGWKNALLPLGILTALVWAAFLPGTAAWAEAGSEAVLQQLHRHQHETQYTTLPEGRLEPLRQSDGTALVVTMEKPEQLYLRGFTGARIENNRWMPLDTGILAENQELLLWLNSREFDLRAQFESAAAVMEADKNTVTVQNVGACSGYRYIPFTLCADQRLTPENLTDTVTGARYDSFTTVYAGASMLSELLTALETADRRYLQAEAAYREFVKDHYLTVPEDMAEKLQPYWDCADGMEPQAAVLAVLERCYPDGPRQDPFYATAAVLTLRRFGIPARYAEGYILPLTTATTVELTGRNAACWAEVYQEGIGWVPMVLTPGLEGETEQEEQTTPPDTPSETLPPETEPAAEPQPEGGYQVRIAQRVLRGTAVTVLLLILAAAAVILRRRHILNKRRAFLEGGCIRESITWAFADAVSALEHMGILRGNGSLDVLIPPIEARFGRQVAEDFRAASIANARALFSSHPMTDGERQTVLAFRDTSLSLLRGSVRGPKKFWLQYILCRF